MPVLTADRTPDQLVAELERLIGVDWPTVWAGVPEDEGKRTYWCAGFGWRPLWFEGGLHIRTAGGGRLYLATVAPGRPVTRAEHTVWSAQARGTGENERVLALAEARWTACLDALRGFMGAPQWDGMWDAPDFPELPGRAWFSRERRLEHRDPYRVAVWRFRTPEAPLIELKMTSGLGSPSRPAPADARIGLACHGPFDPEDRGPAWLG
ncbi:hypothetical protein ACFYWX_04295 [Streptomyces sp. NPDC002888]|uniref:hypothetical protein n=1 Tax=Streptomyces sp. NPDC002888 TaxID=3364668 RepID=UPI00369468C9